MPTASLEFTLFLNTAGIGRGMGSARKVVADGIRGMAQSAKEESQRIQSALSSITAFRELKQSVVETRAEWAKTQAEATRLGTALNQVGPPVKGLKQEFEKAKQAAAEAQGAFIQQSVALNSLRTSMAAAGVSTTGLASTQARLRAELAANEASFQSQARAMQRMQDAKNLLGFKSDHSAEREIQRLEAAYKRLAASGKLSHEELARAHTTLQTEIAEVRNGIGQAEASWASHFQMTTLGFAALMASLAGVNAALTGSFAAFSRFTFHMAEVYTLSDAAPATFAKVSHEMRTMSAEMGRSASDSAQALYNVVSAGVALEKGVEVVRLATKAAVAGVSDVKTAATIGIQVINAYGKNLNELEGVYDLLFKTVKIGVTTLPELAQELGVVLPIARNAGVSFLEVSAAMAEMTKAGIRTPEAATALKAMIKDLASPAPESAQRMRELGISWQGLIPTLTKIASLNLGVSDIRKIVPEVRADTALLSLTSRLKNLMATLEEMGDSAGATEVAYQKVAATPEEKIRHLKAAMEELSIQMGSVVSGATTPVIEGLTGLAQSASRASPVVGILTGAVGTFVAGSLAWNLGLKQMAAGLALGSANAFVFARSLNSLTAGSLFASLANGIDAVTAATARLVASPVGLAMLTAAGAYHVITKRAADHKLAVDRESSALARQADQFNILTGLMKQVNQESATLGNSHLDRPIAEMLLSVKDGTLSFVEAQKQAKAYADEVQVTAGMVKNAMGQLKAAENDLFSSGRWATLNEQTKRFSVAMVAPVEAAKEAFVKAIGVTDNQLTRYNEALNQHKEKLKATVDNETRSYKEMADAAATAFDTTNQMQESQFARRREQLQDLANSFLAFGVRPALAMLERVERNAQEQNFSQRAMLQAFAALATEETDARLREAERYQTKALLLAEQEYQAKKNNATRLGLDEHRVEEERLQAKKSVLEKTAAAYRQSIDRMISEEKRLRDEAYRLTEQRKDFSASVAERIAAIREKGMDPVQVYLSRQKRIAREQSQAETELQAGNFESARKHAEKMVTLAEATFEAVKVGSKTVVEAKQAESRAIEQIRTAEQLHNDSLQEESRSKLAAADALAKSVEASTDKLGRLRDTVQEVDRLLAKEHTIIIDTDTKAIAELGPKIDELLAKIKPVVAIKAELQGGAKELESMLADALNGKMVEFEDKAKRASTLFQKFRTEFAGWQPEIKAPFDATAAAGAVRSITDKIEELKAADQALADKKVSVTVDTTQAVTGLESLAGLIEQLPSEKTVTIHYVEKREGDSSTPAPGFARGGFLPGWGGGDRIPALLEAGEFVLNRFAVRRYGLDRLHAMNRMNLPRFVQGGLVSPPKIRIPSIPRFEFGGVVRNLVIPTIPAMPAFASGGAVNPQVESVVRLELYAAGRPVATIPGPRQQIRQFVDALQEMQRGLR
ncbi:MAG: phage tail tape measure protein [Magnetococcales bacterium]|nr:phage tail tape measure protein [Magnetococcales bacterium]